MSKLQKKQASKIGDVLNEKKSDLQELLNDQVGVSRFVQVAQNAVYQNKNLAKCSVDSLYSSLLKSAEMGLQPDSRQGALIPYWDNDSDQYYAQFQPMVQGISTLMLRSPGVVKVEARAVRESDKFDFAYGTESYIEHEPDLDNDDDEVVASYAIIFWEDADPTYEVASGEDIRKARQASKASNSPAWQNWTAEMARKVPLKRASKYVDLTPRASQAITHDNQLYDVEANQESSDVDELNEWAKGNGSDENESSQNGTQETVGASVSVDGDGETDEPTPWADKSIEDIKELYEQGTITAQQIVSKEREQDEPRDQVLDWASAKLDKEAQSVNDSS